MISAFTWVCGVGDPDPFDAVDLGDLAAGQARGRLGARLVLRVLDVDRLLARLPLVLLEDEGAGAGGVGDLRVGIGVGDALGHHEGHVGRRLAERFEHQAVGLLQHHLEGLGVGRARARSTTPISFWPIESLAPQRLIEATQSSAVTGLPSCHSRPSRRVKVQVSLSGETVPLVDHLRLDLRACRRARTACRRPCCRGGW